MFDLRGHEFVAFFAQLTASTDQAFFDVVTDSEAFGLTMTFRASCVVSGAPCTSPTATLIKGHSFLLHRSTLSRMPAWT